MALILILEDEKLLRWALTEQLTRAGHTVHAAANLAEAKEHLGRHQPDVALLDLSLPDGHGLDFYQDNRRQLEDSVVIVMTAVGQVEDAVRAMKLGALDFLNKPVDHQELVALVGRSLDLRSDQLEAQAARQSRERDLDRELVAESPAFAEVLRVVDEVARSEIGSILLLGESGSGKNVLARRIHQKSPRRQRPFIEVPCAAIPDQLMESELLGHERGAFTDAKATRKGAFELAEGGTVALDEIGELKAELQSKLLHVLEERRLRRVGGSREILIDVRVIALTNRDLAAMVRAGGFRQDLFYRLNVFPITVPPLRDHPEDILPLARRFVGELAGQVRPHLRGLQPRGREQPAGLRLAGQRARAAQRRRAGDDPRARGPDRAGRAGPGSGRHGAEPRARERRGRRHRTARADGAAAGGAGDAGRGQQPDPRRHPAGHHPRSAALPAAEVRPAPGAGRLSAGRKPPNLSTGTAVASFEARKRSRNMHLLVLDGSLVLPSLVRRLAPPGVDVESAATFDEARLRLTQDPPEAMIVNLTPAELPWQELQNLCQDHSPPIPVLYESCVHHSPGEAGLAALATNGHFIEKPYSLPQLRAEIERLVRGGQRPGRLAGRREPALTRRSRGGDYHPIRGRRLGDNPQPRPRGSLSPPSSRGMPAVGPVRRSSRAGPRAGRQGAVSPPPAWARPREDRPEGRADIDARQYAGRPAPPVGSTFGHGTALAVETAGNSQPEP